MKNRFFFKAIAIIKDEKQGFFLYNINHNYKATFLKVYFIYQKTTETEKVLKQITNHL